MPFRDRGTQGQDLWAQPWLETVHQVPNVPPLRLLEGIHPALNLVDTRCAREARHGEVEGLSQVTPGPTGGKPAFPVVLRPAWPAGYLLLTGARQD